MIYKANVFSVFLSNGYEVQIERFTSPNVYNLLRAKYADGESISTPEELSPETAEDARRLGELFLTLADAMEQQEAEYCNCGDCSDTPLEQRPSPIKEKGE